MTRKSTSLRIAQIIKLSRENRDKSSPSRYAFVKSGRKICSKCVSFNQRRFALDDDWEIVNDPVNISDPYLFCDHCGDRIKQLNV